MTVWFGYDGERADRITKTMGAEHLAELETLLERGSAVVPMREVRGQPNDVIGMRHDVDHDLAAAVKMAGWEHERGYRSTYFLLHTAWYWRKPGEEKLSGLLEDAVDRIASLGHEIGFHNNCLALSRLSGTAAAEMLHHELGLLRGLGHEVVGVAAHGDPACYDKQGTFMFSNYEMFSECFRRNVWLDETRHRPPHLLSEQPAPWIQPSPLATFGLEYESIFLPRGLYLSDSGGRWNDLDRSLFPSEKGQLHVLLHPDWWSL